MPANDLPTKNIWTWRHRDDGGGRGSEAKKRNVDVTICVVEDSEICFSAEGRRRAEQHHRVRAEEDATRRCTRVRQGPADTVKKAAWSLAFPNFFPNQVAADYRRWRILGGLRERGSGSTKPSASGDRCAVQESNCCSLHKTRLKDLCNRKKTLPLLACSSDSVQDKSRRLALATNPTSPMPGARVDGSGVGVAPVGDRLTSSK